MSLVAFKLGPSSLFSVGKFFLEPSYIFIRNYAARKGTRERKAKKKVKKEVEEKVKFIPESQRKKDKLLAVRRTLKYDDSWKVDPIDDVYKTKYYRWKIHPFEEAVQMHRETHHPDMYNEPNANLHVRIELNMQGEKATRFVEDFARTVAIPHKFDHGEVRSIIAFSKTISVQKEAIDAGADLVGGVDLVKQIQSGAVLLHDFKYIIAHPEILPELVPLRGLMKRRFPNTKMGTLDVDLGGLTEKFMNGISYSAKKDEFEKDFGLIETIVGKLGMESKHLEENYAALINDVYSMKPKREGDFISRCLLWSPPSPERFKVSHDLYLKSDGKVKNQKQKIEEEVIDEEEVGERVTL